MKTPAVLLTISDITRRIKTTLEQSFTNLTLQGEISNFKHHSSGHMYFTLKDEGAQLQAVMWRSRVPGLTFTPQDGMKVVARGNITVYEVRGVYQIDVQQLQPLGVGDLQVAFDKLKQKLLEEGLFRQERKRPLPRFPKRVALVTSPTGAAVRDMLQIMARRCSSMEVVLVPVRVQGEGAAADIAGAIDDCNRFGAMDVIIVGRGGGSLEDLWAFNEEIVARAIYRSAIPVVSAVGHEVDFTIADFVADLRAPTPSAAAELVVPKRDDLVEIVRNISYTTGQLVRDRLASDRKHIRSLIGSYAFNKPFDKIRQFSQRSDELRNALHRMVTHRVALLEQECVSLTKRMDSVHPGKVLERGYAMVMRDDKVVPAAALLRTEDKIVVRFRDGSVPARVEPGGTSN
jgi:exodeoxyribonuclease VII large subunit